VVGLIPSEQLGNLVLSNAFPTGVPDALAESFLDLVFTGSVTRDWVPPWNKLYASITGTAIEAAKTAYGTRPVSPSPSLPLAAYAGTYQNEYLGTANVVEENDTLMLKLGSRKTKSYALKHFHRDLFVYFPYEETPDVPSGVNFKIGPDQKASHITIDNFPALRLTIIYVCLIAPS